MSSALGVAVDARCAADPVESHLFPLAILPVRDVVGGVVVHGPEV